MSLLSPLCLLALLPWTAVVVWLLTGRRERTAVPFLELWKGSEAPLPRAKAAMHVPPVAILLLLLATLLAILAAARPRVGFLGTKNPPRIVVVIDRGFSMSVGSRWEPLVGVPTRETAGFGRIPIEKVYVPRTEPRLIDTRPLLPIAIREALAEPDSIVFVLTDHTLEIDDPRLIQIVPETKGSNVGFVHAAASDAPRPQVMVRVRNDSELKNAQLKVGGVSQGIDLPAAGEERNYFVDVDRLDKVTPIELVVKDDLDADNRIELTRTATWPRLEAEAGVSPELLRMMGVYGRIRPPQRDSTAIALTTNPTISAGRHGVIIAAADRATTSAIRIDDHPITSVMDWPGIGKEGIHIAPAPRSDWKIVARAGEDPILAVRETPARQVWVGFASDSFARGSDFVIFWTNVFDWVGQGDERFVAAGTFALPIPVPPKIDWRSRLANLPANYQPGSEISSLLAVAAAFMIFVATLVWGVAKPAR